MTKVRVALVEILRLIVPLLIGGIIGLLWLMSMPHGI
jgi:hypothetical protein